MEQPQTKNNAAEGQSARPALLDCPFCGEPGGVVDDCGIVVGCQNPDCNFYPRAWPMDVGDPREYEKEISAYINIWNHGLDINSVNLVNAAMEMNYKKAQAFEDICDLLREKVVNREIKDDQLHMLIEQVFLIAGAQIKICDPPAI